MRRQAGSNAMPANERKRQLFWHSGISVGRRHEINSAAVEVDGGDEVGFAAETASGVLDPLDLRVDGLAGGVGDAMLQVGHDVVETTLDHTDLFDHRAQSAANTMPPAEVLA